MELHIFLVVLLGAVSCSHGKMSASVVKMTVRPGDNITLYCDCKSSPGVYIVWYRNCSDENHTTLVFDLKYDPSTNDNTSDLRRSFPNFRFLKNSSSDSYDLLISNIADSDEGLYYCGTQENKVEDMKDKGPITVKTIYKYGSTATRIICDSSESHYSGNHQDCGSCWTLLFTLCPVFAVLSSLLTSLVIYQLCQKKADEPQVNQQRPDTRGQTRQNQDEDVCYAALEIRQPSQRPKKKKEQSFDFSTYSDINTSTV